MDGWITIGTELSTDKFDRQVLQLEKKMKKEEDKKIILGAKIEVQEDELEEARKKTDELADAYQRLEGLQKKIASGKATPQQFTMAQDLQSTYGSIEQLELAFLKALNKQDAIDQKAQEMKTKYQEINEKVAEYKQKIESIKLQKHAADVDKLKSSFNGVGNSIQDSIKKVGKLALGVFGIRSAFLGIRQAVSMLSQYNDTLSNQIQAIKLSLISAIEPVINFIVGVVSKVVSFLGYVLKTLFGIDIFARATALNFAKINKGASGTSKAVKEIRKQLAGFDEMNVLNEDGTTGIASGLGASVADLSQNLADLNAQGEEVFKNFKKWFLGSDKTTFKGIWDDNMVIIQGFIGDVQKAFQPIGDWIDKNVWIPTKTFFQQTWKDVEPYIAPIKEAFQKTISEIEPYWTDFIDNFLKPLWAGFAEHVGEPLIEMFEPIGIRIYNSLVPYINAVIDFLNKAFGGFGLHIEKMEYKTEKATNNVGNNAKKNLDNVGKNAESNGSKVDKKLNTPLKTTASNVKNLSKQKIDIKTSTSKIDTLKTKIKQLWDAIKKIVGKSLDVNIYASAGGGTGSKGYGGGVGTRAKGGIFYPSMLPKLAVGGIINQPGRGVPYNGAIIGERGAEAVVPLTDSQQMELLGQTIGKYININATVPVYVGNRQVAREIKKINAENDFAYNK